MGARKKERRAERKAEASQPAVDVVDVNTALASIPTERFAALANRSFSRATLLECLPPGEDPIATRADPWEKCVQVACASGRTFKIALTDLMVAEVRVVQVQQRETFPAPPAFAPDEPIQLTANQVAAEARASRAAMMRKLMEDKFNAKKADAQQGPEQATPEAVAEEMTALDEKWDQYDAEKLREFFKQELERSAAARRQQQAQANADGCTCGDDADEDGEPCPVHDAEPSPAYKPRKPPQRHAFVDMWEMAEARLAELTISEGGDPENVKCMCPSEGCALVSHSPLVAFGPSPDPDAPPIAYCANKAEVLLRGVFFKSSTPDALGVCGQCARSMLARHYAGMALLDWNPEE